MNVNALKDGPGMSVKSMWMSVSFLHMYVVIMQVVRTTMDLTLASVILGGVVMVTLVKILMNAILTITPAMAMQSVRITMAPTHVYAMRDTLAMDLHVKTLARWRLVIALNQMVTTKMME